MAIIIEHGKGGFSYKRDTIGLRVSNKLFSKKKPDIPENVVALLILNRILCMCILCKNEFML